MFEGIKSFYNKDRYDSTRPFLDPLEYHNTFYYILKAFHVIDTEIPIPIYRNQNVYILTSFLIAMILTAVSILHGIHTVDIPLVTEAGAYFLILFYGILILSCTKQNLPEYQNLLRCITDDFYYICTSGYKYRKRFLRNQLKTWKICIISLIFSFGITIGMVIVATVVLLFYLATRNPEEESQRPLLFPFRVKGVNFGETPLYEIAFMFSNLAVLAYSYNYVFMLQTQIVWIRHITTKTDIVIWSIKDLLVDVHPTTMGQDRKLLINLLQERLKKILIQHHDMYRLINDYSKVYKKCLMFEQTFCGPIACLTAYCAAEKFDEGEFNAILILLFFATVVLYFVPSYFCTFLALKVGSVCEACWNTPFWNADPIIRPYMVLIMLRSIKPLQLHPAGFQTISIETFSKKMTSAYSFFNMLRQANRKKI